VTIEPLLMIPAFRCGRETLWGGERLRLKYGKFAIASKIGESLELCDKPGRETCTPDGHTLSFLIRQYGQDLIGAQVKDRALPKIKFIDCEKAREVALQCMSPSPKEDTGSSSKVFVVLEAGDAARMITGFSPDLSMEELHDLLNKEQLKKDGFSVSALHAGDVIKADAGAVYGLGEGCLLYEVCMEDVSLRRICVYPQDEVEPIKAFVSSDEADGILHNAKRKITWLKPVDEIDADCQCQCLSSDEHFSIYRIRKCDGKRLEAAPVYRVTTFLADAKMCLDTGKTMYISAGQTVLIPAQTCGFTLFAPDFLMVVPQV